MSSANYTSCGDFLPPGVYTQATNGQRGAKKKYMGMPF